MAYVIVDAEITRVFFEGKGAGLKESFKLRNGEEGARYWSAFFEDPHGLSEGDRGTFKGLLGAKVSEYTDREGNERHGVDVTINNTKFERADDDGDEAPF